MKIATTHHLLGILLTIAAVLAYLVYLSGLGDMPPYGQLPLWVITITLLVASVASWRGASVASKNRRWLYGVTIVLNIFAAIFVPLLYVGPVVNILYMLFDLHAILVVIAAIFVILPLAIILSGIALVLPAKQKTVKSKAKKPTKKKTK